MTRKIFFILGLVISLFGGWGLERVNAQTSVNTVGEQYKNHGKIVLSSAPQAETARELAPPKAPAVDKLTPTGKMLKGKAVPPAKKEKPYPAPEVDKSDAKDRPYPAPELKKPAQPKKPAVTAPVPAKPPAKTAPVAPVPAPAPAPGGVKILKDEGS